MNNDQKDNQEEIYDFLSGCGCMIVLLFILIGVFVALGIKPGPVFGLLCIGIASLCLNKK